MDYDEAAMSGDPTHARVLVIGPMGVGKTSLVDALCHDQREQEQHHLQRNRKVKAHLKRPRPTVGCNVDVKLIPGGGRGDRYIEFWDIGGHPDAAIARRMFFKDSSIAGVLLVYDQSNPRSIRELGPWIADLESAGISVGLGVENNLAMERSKGILSREGGLTRLYGDVEGGARTDFVPMMIVGNKRDLPLPSQGCSEAFPPAVARIPLSSVSALDLNEEPFQQFFEDVFRYRHVAAGRERSSEASSTLASTAAPFEPQGFATRRRDRHHHHPDRYDPALGRVTQGSRSSETVPGSMNWGRSDGDVESRWSYDAFPRDGTATTAERHGDGSGWCGVPAPEERAWSMARDSTARPGSRLSITREKQT